MANNGVEKLEKFQSKYVVERSAYRLDQDFNIVHLRMLSPDNGKTNIERFSYTIRRGDNVFTTEIENKALKEMENRMDEKLKELPNEE